ncbi:MAG: hypothetical protein R2849_04225 [Thermomicrobiales bacterium]
MAATALVVELGKVAEKVQDQAMNENSPYRGQPILDETSQSKSLDELRANILEARRQMIELGPVATGWGVRTAARRRRRQPGLVGGEIITHSNSVLMGITGRAAERIGVDPGLDRRNSSQPGRSACSTATPRSRPPSCSTSATGSTRSSKPTSRTPSTTPLGASSPAVLCSISLSTGQPRRTLELRTANS